MDPDRVFYDGDCGFCHRSVRFLLARDPEGGRFRFAPIDGPTFRESLAPDRRKDLPDSLIVLTPDDRLLLESDATVHLLRRLPGLWPWLGTLLGWVPKRLRDLGYRVVARNRQRLFARPEAACPVLPPDRRARFDP